MGAKVNEGDAEIVVFSKPHIDDIDIAKLVKSNGGKVVVDYCDPLFEERPHYLEIMEYADQIVVGTEVSRDIVHEYTQTPVAVIPDPYEMEEVRPHADGPNLLWFGHSSNLEDIYAYKSLPQLRIVTGPGSIKDCTHWSPQNITRAMSESNICLLPTRPGAEYKTANRFLNAVRQGLYPICGRHPAYKEFRLAYQGEMITGINWAGEFLNELNGMVSELQDQIRDKYSPDTIAAKWKDLLGSI